MKEGRNIRSPELGLPGNVGCRVYWDPVADDGQGKVLADPARIATHDLGNTGFIYATSPVWSRAFPSENAKRLDILLPSEGAFFDMKGHAEQAQQKELEFPFLHPIEKSNDVAYLTSWKQAPGSIVVDVQFSDLLNVLPNSVYSIGEVKIPFKTLMAEGKMRGWFDVMENHLPSRFQLAGASDTDKVERPQIFLEATWVAPEVACDLPIEMHREASVAIQEELVRSASLTKQQKEKMSILGSSIGALNTVRGISSNLHMVQNTLSTVLDIVEGAVHLFDFSVRLYCARPSHLTLALKDPFKSIVVLGVLVIVWIVLSVVSTRAIVFIVGVVRHSCCCV